MPPFDEENPEWTAETFARSRPANEVLPSEVIAAFGRARGRPVKANRKVAVSLRLDPDVVEYFRSGGDGWQSRMNETLRSALPRP